eukprot:366167-Chlamydomonas_euryale.AAC.1
MHQLPIPVELKPWNAGDAHFLQERGELGHAAVDLAEDDVRVALGQLVQLLRALQQEACARRG